MTVTHFTDHVSRGVERLIERYRKPNTSALLAAWLGEIQAAEDAYWQLYVERSVGVAVGEQLDILGRIVGQPRNGMTDDLYRVWIAARTLVWQSSGRPEELIAICKQVLGPSEPVLLTEYYPASFTVDIAANIDAATGQAIAELMREAKPAGVGMLVLWAPQSDVFTFAPADVIVAPSPLGFDAGRFRYASDGTPTDGIIAAEVPFELNAADIAGGFNTGVLGSGGS